jgi:mono/diheme cytochrome c family protein
LFTWAVMPWIALWFTVGLGTLTLAGGTASAQEDMTYKIYCSRCHGDSGQGDGADAGTLKTSPRNFTDCAVMGKVSDDTMFKAIKDGGASVGVSGDMPAWGSGLSDDDIHGVMKYIRNFCKK